MTDKQLALSINKFLDLNPKKSKFPKKITNAHLEAYLLIQEYFKNHEAEIRTANYDHLFYNHYNSLAGAEWVKILLSTKNISKYYKLIRVGYSNCRTKKLKKKLLLELFYWSDHDNWQALVNLSEQNFNQLQITKLKKLRQFIEDQDWPNYFFNLQKVMHEQIIQFLNWNGTLKFDKYCKVFEKRLSLNLNCNQVNYYLNLVSEINWYRNSLAKAIPSDTIKNQELKLQWINSNDLIKKAKAWEFYSQVINLIFVISLIENKS